MGVGDALYLGVADGFGVADPYGLGVGDFSVLSYFFVLSYFLVEAGDFSGAVVVVAVSVLLVLQEARSPAASITVME